MNIKNFIGATILAGVTALGAYAVFGCGEDELANKLKNSPKPQDEIINADYDAGSMLPDFGVSDAGYDAANVPDAQFVDAALKDVSLEDIYDAGVNDTGYDTGVLDAQLVDVALADVNTEDVFDVGYDAAVQDAEMIDADLDAELSDAGLEDVLNADVDSVDAETLDGAVADAGSMAPVVKYLLNGAETTNLSLLQTDYLKVDASSSYSPKVGLNPMDGISHCSFDLGGYISREDAPDCKFETELYMLPAEQAHSLNVTACDNGGECSSSEGSIYIQP